MNAILAHASADESLAEVWPPRNLPVELHAVATAVDLIRHEHDFQLGGGAGVCRGVSSFVSHLLSELEIDHNLVTGSYRDSFGLHPHWWVETSSGWILDASRGQFDQQDKHYRPSVTLRSDESYTRPHYRAPFTEGLDAVLVEMKYGFTFEDVAGEFLNLYEEVWEEAQRMIENTSLAA